MNMNVALPDAETGIEQKAQSTLYLNWFLELVNGSKLDNNYLRLTELTGQDELSSPFTFNLTLQGNTDSTQPQFKIGELIGRSITVALCADDDKRYYNPKDPKQPDYSYISDMNALMEGDSTQYEHFSFFNGMVTGFSMSQPGVYNITMRPALWRLMLTNNYRIHTQKSIRTLIDSLMAEHNIDCNTQDLMGDTNTASTRIQDWFQAGETDYEFLQRVMAKANIHYYFVHKLNSHQIVFSNKASYPNVFTDGRSFTYTYTEMEGVEDASVLKTYSYKQEISSTGAKGVYTRQEEAWESDTVAGQTSFSTDTSEDVGDMPFNIYKIFQYGGSKAEVENFVSQTASMLDSSATSLEGSAHNPAIRVGHQVLLETGVHSGPEKITDYLNGTWFVFTQTQYQASLDGTFTVNFKATESDSLITPFSSHNTHQGTVLAEVIAHGSSVAPTTWQYYEKNNFAPEVSIDRDSQAAPTTLQAQGVFVRFTSDPPTAEPVWIKLSASMQTCPEIGVIVIVARANDESELPEIQQMVQANGSKVVTPSGWTANTHVGSSYSTNYGDGKSIRYGQASQTNLDQAIAIISKEYDSGLFRDSSYSQGGGYSYSTSESGRSGMLSKSESYGNTYSHHEGEISNSYSDVTQTESVSLNDTVSSTSTITSWSNSNHHNEGDSTNVNQVDGLSKSTNTLNNVDSTNMTKGYTKSTNTNVGSVTNTSTNIGPVTNTSTHSTVNSTGLTGSEISQTTHGMTSSTSAVGASQSISTVGTTTSLATIGSQSIVSLTGSHVSTSMTGTANQTNVSGSSVNTSIVGTSTNTGITGTSTSTSVTGTSKSSNVIGSSKGTNTIGSSTDTSMTGSSVRTSLTGASVNTNLVGASVDTSIVGASTGVSIKGVTAGIDITGAGLNMTLTPGVVTVGITGINLSIPIIDLVI